MYIIKKTDRNITDIYDEAWDSANVAEISTINWAEYDYCPKTTAKLLYNENGIYIQMKTDEKPLLARVTEKNGEIYKDSCMEFFICPKEGDKRYMNFELNPFGTMYFNLRTGRDDGEKQYMDRDCFNIISKVEEDLWTLQYVIPFDLIDKIFGGHSKNMKGNLYKCGDETERVHFLSYYPIKTEAPDFHRSEFFGDFILE